MPGGRRSAEWPPTARLSPPLSPPKIPGFMAQVSRDGLHLGLALGARNLVDLGRHEDHVERAPGDAPLGRADEVDELVLFVLQAAPHVDQEHHAAQRDPLPQVPFDERPPLRPSRACRASRSRSPADRRAPSRDRRRREFEKVELASRTGRRPRAHQTLCRPMSLLSRLDLPTLERPAKATSASAGGVNLLGRATPGDEIGRDDLPFGIHRPHPASRIGATIAASSGLSKHPRRAKKTTPKTSAPTRPGSKRTIAAPCTT